MKKRVLIFIVCFVAIFLAFLACQDDNFIVPRGKPDFKNPASLPPELRQAMEWYQENNHRVYELKTKGSSHPLFDEMEPYWEQSFVRSNQNYKTIETTLKTLTSTLFINPASEEMYRLSGDKRYRQTITRLVIRTDLKTGETIGFFMSIIPDPDYLERTDFQPFHNTYLERDEYFGGIVIYHDLNGTRANGWVFQDGKPVSIIPRSDIPSPVRTRGYTYITRCVDTYREFCKLWHVVTEADGEIVNEYDELGSCHTEYAGQNCWEEQIYTPDVNPGGGSGSGGGFNPDWEYNSPACPVCKHSVCTCIKAGDCDEYNAEVLSQMYDQFKGAGVESKFIDVHKSDSVEWGTVLYDSCGTVYMDRFHTNNKQNSVQISIKTTQFKKALTTIHNHPSGNGPSPTDAMTLAHHSNIFGIHTSYVCTSDNRIFALVVTDPNAAKKFNENYKDSVSMSAMNDFYKEYHKELQLYDEGHYDPKLGSLYSLSTLLHVLNSGIEVMEGVVRNGLMTFNLRKGEWNYVDGKRIIKRTKCF